MRSTHRLCTRVLGVAFGVLGLGATLVAQGAHMTFQGNGYPNDWQFGRSVCGVGDITGDGIDDLGFGYTSGKWFGKLRVVSGADGSLVTEWIFDQYVAFGMSIQRMGDANGDGVGDIVLGSPDDHPDGAWFDAVTIRSGVDGSLLMQQLPSLGPMQQPRVSGAGDINGDGLEDVIMCDTSQTQVYSGANGALLLTLSGLLPSSVSDFGDYDGDGVPDLLVGGLTTVGSLGTVIVYSGANGAPLLFVGGKPANHGYGTSLDLLGDLDGDGLPEFAVGAPQTNVVGGGGYVEFVSSATGTKLLTVRGDPGDRLGTSIAKAGDVNGDGWPDLIIGVPQSGDGHGKALVVSGTDGSVLRTWTGDSLGEHLGMTVQSAGDVNQDGYADVIVGSPDGGPYAGFGGYYAGIVRVFTGCPGVMAPFGLSCMGSGGYAPMLVMGGCPVVGEHVQLQVKRALGNSLALLFVGLPLQPPVSLASGCSLALAPPFLFMAALPVLGSGPGKGTLTLNAVIPNFVGTIALQAFVADPAVPGGHAATNGLLLEVAAGL